MLGRERIELITILKVDVEGGEANVLLGLIHTIRKCQPIIICEVLPLHSKSEEVRSFRNESALKILQMMKDLDYQIINIKTGHEVKAIHEFSASLESSNYIFLPAD